jgi:hypothetical protein
MYIARKDRAKSGGCRHIQNKSSRVALRPVAKTSAVIASFMVNNSNILTSQDLKKNKPG